MKTYFLTSKSQYVRGSYSKLVFFCVQVVQRASMENSAIRSVTVPITDAATEPMEPVCVILDSTDASATFVSPTILSPDSHP